MFFLDIQSTTQNKIAGYIRLMLAVIFLMTGPMKIFVPHLTAAWHGQLIAAQIPLFDLAKWVVPLAELALGILLAAGLFVRLAVIVAIGIMLVATYVHIIIEDPSLFPLQPNAPIIPIMVIVGSLYLLWHGGGMWSKDLQSAIRSKSA